jgi:hypothetical protein
MSRALRLRHRLIGLRVGSSRHRYNTACGGRRQQSTSRDIIHDAYPFMISDCRDAQIILPLSLEASSPPGMTSEQNDEALIPPGFAVQFQVRFCFSN